MTRRRNNMGFTLMEIILAVALTIALMGGIFAFYLQGLKIRDHVNEQMDILLSERLIMDRITSELRSAMQFRFLRMGMAGEEEKAQWISAQLPGPGAWAVRKTTDDPIPPETDIQIIGYRLRVGEDEEGQPVVEGLERTSQKVLAPVVAEEGEPSEGKEIEVVLISPRIKYLRFRYWDGNGWINNWDGGDVPGAVEISMGIHPLPEGTSHEDYDEDVFRRVVYIPGGVHGQGGSTVRGLARGGGGRQ
ncbi:MAG TPA: hypothetical protein ENH84_05015 [Phycisphaerae bacterium]|nr:hypothetical protein [Phycisphaerae bacterium]